MDVTPRARSNGDDEARRALLIFCPTDEGKLFLRP
jgi:hypothetical protein